MKNINIKRGMTMAEMLIVLGILGVIATMCMPSIRALIPRKYEAMMKKGAYNLEHAVSDLVSSDILYERTDVPNPTNFTMTHRHGLQSTYRVILDGQTYGSDVLNTEAGMLAARQKFCRLLATRFELAPGSHINCTPHASLTSECGNTLTCPDGEDTCDENSRIEIDNCPSFISRDGIQWVIPISDFSNGPEVILYKTSTRDDFRAPNCARVQESTIEAHPDAICEAKTGEGSVIASTEADCERPDIAIYLVYPDGTLHKDEATSDEVPID